MKTTFRPLQLSGARRDCIRLGAALGIVFAGALVDAAQTIYTNQVLFHVPFSLAAEGAGHDQSAVEAVLFVSGDQGRTWHLYQTRAMQDRRFSFRAGDDGEFWFTVRTKVAGGDPPPATGLSPEVIVVVDRQRPSIEMNAQVGAGGLVEVYWMASDSFLGSDCIQLEYRTGPHEPWRPVTASQERSGSSNGSWNGTSRFEIPQDGSSSVIRATVTDRAGNITVQERPLAGPSVSGNPPATAPEPSYVTNSMSTAAADKLTGTISTGPSLPGPPTPTGTPSVTGPAFADASQTRESSPLTEGWAPAPSIPPSVDKQGLPGEQGGLSRFSRSRRFQLEYVIENAQSGGVHRVEVWHTHDGGRSWRHYGDDPDRSSPFAVEVPADGVYGFRLLVQAREGLVAQPPRSGDRPDVWITVDSQPPAARITSATFDRSQIQGQLRIQWDAHDPSLAEAPVTLLFGPSNEGPWRKIVSQAPNAGSYLWQLDDRVPEEFHLRLEVRDQAGNIGVDVTPSSIRRDGFVPHGVIRDVTPTGYRAPMR